MTASIRVYLEVADKRAFASAIDWPGWSRSGRTIAAALDALASAGPRYAGAMGAIAAGLATPVDGAGFDVAQEVRGGAGTDFGVPSRSPDGDDRPVGAAELERLTGILRAALAAFDAAAIAAEGRALSTGPRGGGRSLAKMIGHVHESDWAYLGEIGGSYRSAAGVSEVVKRDAVRAAIVVALAARVRGDPVPPSKRVRPFWTPRYLVRRSAWHALDHAWELEDRLS